MNAPERWAIIQISLNEPLTLLPEPVNAAGAYIVFWWHDLPMGHVLVSAGEFPLTPADLATRATRVTAPAFESLCFGTLSGLMAVGKTPSELPQPPSLDDYLAASHLLPRRPLCDTCQPVAERISVVVCTRRRPDHLRNCLESLKALDPAPNEIIVVDNAPDDSATRLLVEQYPSVTYVAEPEAGLSQARNTGVRQASGDIIAFTDDDVRVDPRWLSGVGSALEGGVQAMTGLVLPAELETNAQLQFETNFGFNAGYQPRLFDSAFFRTWMKKSVPVWLIGAGANMAFRRTAFSAIGLFDTRLGAGASGCSEDSEFWYRMLAAGLNIRYDPRAVVWHCHRVTPTALRSQMRQYMRGHVVALFVQYQRHRHSGHLRRAFGALPYYFYRRLRQVRRKQAAAVWFAGFSGYLWGFFTYARTRHMPGAPSMAGSSAQPSLQISPSVSPQN